jgi:hypothetical protein
MAKLENVKILDMVNGEPTRVVYNGAIYEKTEDDAEAGDLVRVIDEDISDVEIGGFYKVYKDADDDLYFNDDVEDKRDCDFWADELETFRKVSETKDSADLAERLTELERRFEALEKHMSVTESAPKFKVGDYVKLSIKDGKSPKYGWGGAKNGDIGKVVEVEYDGTVRVDFPNQEGWLADPSEIVLVTDEEVAQVKVKMQTKFEVGDYARVVSEGRWGDIEAGNIVKIVAPKDDDDEYKAELLDGSDYDYFHAEQLEKVTEGEAKEIARWAKIGRKPGEFKKGDFVKLTLSDGRVYYGEIDGQNTSFSDVRYFFKDHEGDVSTELPDNLTLIAPVGQRFDFADAEGARQ